MKATGTIIATYGRQYRVEFPGGEIRLCFPKGKKSDFACGDRVTVECDAGDQGLITGVEERTSLFYRSNAFRQKLIAANVTQIVVVVAVEPSFSPELLTRCLVAAESQELDTLIVLNKCDLGDAIADALCRLEPFERNAYRIIRLSARVDATPLRPFLAGKRSLLVGQSGMGKSTLINALFPEANAATREISAALDSGKHTTTRAMLYWLDAETALIDSPGLQDFGLLHLTLGAIEQGFPEFRPHLGQCRFHNCRHDREPGCAIRAALERGEIAPERFSAFQSICRG